MVYEGIDITYKRIESYEDRDQLGRRQIFEQVLSCGRGTRKVYIINDIGRELTLVARNNDGEAEVAVVHESKIHPSHVIHGAAVIQGGNSVFYNPEEESFEAMHLESSLREAKI